jgi:hypothetical protein
MDGWMDEARDAFKLNVFPSTTKIIRKMLEMGKMSGDERERVGERK